MLTLLNLLSAVTLLIWGTHIVRTGILRVYGSNLRHVIGQNMSKRWLAFVAGILVTAMVQSSNATAMLVTSFVGQGLMGLMPALATMLGADVGTALMARVLTLDLSWLSPLLIFLGVIFFLTRKQTRAGQLGRVGIGLGLIILALQLIVEAAGPITHAQGVKVLFASLTGDILLDALIGALFAMISYSSLAAVLLTATLAGAGVIGLHVAIGLVIGANIGSGVLAFLSTNMQNAAGRQVALGSLLYKLIGLLLIIPVLDPLVLWMDSLDYSAQGMVISFHLLYNVSRCLILLPSIGPMARVCAWLLPEREGHAASPGPRRPGHAKPGAGQRCAGNPAPGRPDRQHAHRDARSAARQTNRHHPGNAQPQRRRRGALQRDQTLPGANASRRPQRTGQPPLGRDHRAVDQPETGRRPD